MAAAPADAGPGEYEFISRVNSARSSRGIHTYAPRSTLSSVARRHAARMAARGTIYHNPSLQSEVGNWRALAENVGKGSSVSAIHRAFMGSSSHRSNILSRTYTEIGVGTATGGDGMLYVVQIFRLPRQSSTTSSTTTRRTTTTTTTTTRTTTSTPRRAQQSTRSRSTGAVRPAPQPRRVVVSPAVLLRARVRRADVFATGARARGDGLLWQVVVYHDVLRITGPA